MSRTRIFNEISLERDRQTLKWGDQSHHPDTKWMTILVEEVGEAAQEVLDGSRNALIEELIQVAAVTVQWLEILYDRNSSNKKT
jgi:NTP pyrophosphatase (non-canonical NTP hydrolase)